MAIQMQLEIISAGNRIVNQVSEAETTIRRVNKDENGKQALFLYACCLKC